MGGSLLCPFIPPHFWDPCFDPSPFHTLILEPKILHPSAPGRGSARDFRSVSPPPTAGDSDSEVTAGLAASPQNPRGSVGAEGSVGVPKHPHLSPNSQPAPPVPTLRWFRVGFGFKQPQKKWRGQKSALGGLGVLLPPAQLFPGLPKSPGDPKLGRGWVCPCDP